LREYARNPTPENWREVVEQIEWMLSMDWEPICELSCLSMDISNIEEIRDRVADWITEVAREVGLPEDEAYRIRNEFIERFNRVSML
jgi:hypothetical protein